MSAHEQQMFDNIHTQLRCVHKKTFALIGMDFNTAIPDLKAACTQTDVMSGFTSAMSLRWVLWWQMSSLQSPFWSSISCRSAKIVARLLDRQRNLYSPQRSRWYTPTGCRNHGGWNHYSVCRCIESGTCDESSFQSVSMNRNFVATAACLVTILVWWTLNFYLNLNFNGGKETAIDTNGFLKNSFLHRSQFYLQKEMIIRLWWIF